MTQADWYFFFVGIWGVVLSSMIVIQIVAHYVKKSKYQVNKKENIHERKKL